MTCWKFPLAGSIEIFDVSGNLKCVFAGLWRPLQKLAEVSPVASAAFYHNGQAMARSLDLGAGDGH